MRQERSSLPIAMMLVVVPLLLVASASARTVTISPSPLTGTEGNNLTVDCSYVGGGRTNFELTVDDSRIVSLAKFVGASMTPTGTRFVYGPLERSDSDKVFECDDSIGNRASATLVVHYPPAYTLLPSQPTTVLEGEDFTLEFEFDAIPNTTNFTWSRDGQVISSGGRIATSVSTISITSTNRSDSGVYEVVSYNEAGRGAGNFTLDVQYPPEYANTPPVQLTQLMVRALFTLNCTPSAANPPVDTVSIEVDGSPVTSGDTVTVTDNVLTIPSVQRNHSGNYSCTATNTRGSATIYHNLLVVAPPGRPENLAFPSIGPYSVTVTWDPPSDDGGTPDPLNYMVNLTTTSDGQSVFANQTTQTQLTFTALSHSENYTVSVVAVNSLGQQGPSAVGTFRTRDIPPVIGTVTAEALSLSDVQVTVTLSDDGGQPVENYTITINGTAMTFSGSADLQFIGNVTKLSLMNGVTYNVSVVARNSVGASETFTGTMFVPFPPNITMQPVAVTPDETTTQCCAGVRVFLEDPSDPTLVFTAQVSTEDSPFTSRSITREGGVVYVQGLQAGTPYNIRLTAWNNFGSVTKNVSTTPLIGSPSDPSMPVVSVEGSSVSIQLSTRYPGTNVRGQFRFSLIFSAASTAKRQSLQPIEVPVDPTGLDSSVTTTHTLTDVAAGSYSVSVMAENEHGMSQEMSATFVVEAPPTDLASRVDTAVVIGVVVAVVIVILLLILAIFVIVLVCMKRRDTKAMYKPKSEGSGDADYKEMVDTNSTDPLAPQYEDPSTLERQAPPPVVTYKNDEEAAVVQPAPAASGVVYADLDFSRQQAFGSKKPPEKKKPEPIEPVIYSEVRPMTPQEKEPHSPTTIM